MQPVASTSTSGNTIPTDPHLQPQAEAFRQEIAAKFGITNIGGYREGDPEDHGKGLAVDVMVPTNSQLGDQVAQYAIDNMDRAGISYIIWKQQFYMPVTTFTDQLIHGTKCLTVVEIQQTTTTTYISHLTDNKTLN